MVEQLEFCLLDIKCPGSMTDRELKVSPGKARAASPALRIPPGHSGDREMQQRLRSVLTF